LAPVREGLPVTVPLVIEIKLAPVREGLPVTVPLIIDKQLLVEDITVVFFETNPSAITPEIANTDRIDFFIIFKYLD